MEKRKDCMTCFYQFKSPVEEPCVKCKGFALWTDKDAYVVEAPLVYKADGKEIKLEHFWHRKEPNDPVNHPKHYNVGIEPIAAIESWKLNFRLANVIKYVARHQHKGTPLEDLKKAAYYLNREIEKYDAE